MTSEKSKTTLTFPISDEFKQYIIENYNIGPMTFEEGVAQTDPNANANAAAAAGAPPPKGAGANDMMGGQNAMMDPSMGGAGMDPSMGGAGMDMMGGGMGMGMPEEEPSIATTPSEVGRLYEIQKLFYKLKTIDGILAQSTENELIQLKKSADDALEIFQMVVDNLALYKDRLDQVILYFYKYVERVTEVLIKYYKEKQEKIKNKSNSETNEDHTTVVKDYSNSKIDDPEVKDRLEKIQKQIVPSNPEEEEDEQYKKNAANA